MNSPDSDDIIILYNPNSRYMIKKKSTKYNTIHTTQYICELPKYLA